MVTKKYEELVFLEPLLRKFPEMEIIFKFIGKDCSSNFLQHDWEFPFVEGWVLVDGKIVIANEAVFPEAILISLYYSAMDLFAEGATNVVVQTKGPIWRKLRRCRSRGYLQRIEFKPLAGGFVAKAGCFSLSSSFFFVPVWRSKITDALNDLLDIVNKFP